MEVFLYPTSVLLTYLGEVDIDEVFGACFCTGLSVDEVLTTKCGTIMQTISWLLDFSNSRHCLEDLKDLCFDPNKAYTFELQGYSNTGTLTNTGHCFVLINNGTNWLIMDSYIGERKFSSKIVDLTSILDTLCQLKHKFNHVLWSGFTSSNDIGDFTTHVGVLVFEYDYSPLKIKDKFFQLVERAKTRLNNKDIGVDDSYLSLLSHSLSRKDANSYLSSFSNPV